MNLFRRLRLKPAQKFWWGCILTNGTGIFLAGDQIRLQLYVSAVTKTGNLEDVLNCFPRLRKGPCLLLAHLLAGADDGLRQRTGLLRTQACCALEQRLPGGHRCLVDIDQASPRLKMDLHRMVCKGNGQGFCHGAAVFLLDFF